MAPQFAVSNYGPKREPPELLAARAGLDGDRPNRRHIAASLIFHFLVLFGIFLLPRNIEPVDVPVPLVTLVLEENGAAGSAGGSAGGGGGGNGKEAGSAPAQSATAEPAPEEQPAEERPPEKQPGEPTPPTPQATPEPPVPQALAPAPVVVPPPPPKPRPPVVKPRPPAARPAQHVEKKPVEKPSPTVAAEPPPGPSNGQGAAAAQPGSAASGTASAGPGGAAGVGTGVAGAGQGSFGNGKGPGDDYLDRLRRHLAKYKHYPPEAVKRKEEGTVLLSFVLARDGTVLEAAVERSSGFPLIDQAALDMVRNASPVPPLPASFAGDRAHIVMPAGFRIGFFDRLF